MAEAQAMLTRAGPIGLWLVAVSVALWAAVVLRAFALSEGAVSALEVRLRATPPARRPLAFARDRRALEAYAQVITVLVAAAPLLGLLGTVSGMIELFSALHGRAAALQSSVAGGISTALLTTQLGLVIGAPGLVAARLLHRRQLRLEARLGAVVGEGGA